MTLAIEPAAAADEAEVVALWRACDLTVPYNDPASDFRFARAGAASDVLVARAGEGVCATVMVGHDGHRGWLYYVAVAPQARRRGLGAAMVAAAEAWLQERGIAKAQLLVRETNAAVVAFYERLGYEVAPRIVMSRWIDGRN